MFSLEIGMIESESVRVSCETVRMSCESFRMLCETVRVIQFGIRITRLDIAITFVIFATFSKFIFIIKPINYMRLCRQGVFLGEVFLSTRMTLIERIYTDFLPPPYLPQRNLCASVVKLNPTNT